MKIPINWESNSECSRGMTFPTPGFLHYSDLALAEDCSEPAIWHKAIIEDAVLPVFLYFTAAGDPTMTVAFLDLPVGGLDRSVLLLSTTCVRHNVDDISFSKNGLGFNLTLCVF